MVEKNRGVNKISFVGHSLGGLISRYAIGKLYAPPGDKSLCSYVFPTLNLIVIESCRFPSGHTVPVANQIFEISVCIRSYLLMYTPL